MPICAGNVFAASLAEEDGFTVMTEEIILQIPATRLDVHQPSQSGKTLLMLRSCRERQRHVLCNADGVC